MNPTTLENHPAWLAHRTDSRLPLPDVIQLELTAACDLQCTMCPLPDTTRYGTGREYYEPEDLTKLREVFVAASTIELTGFGEILTHPRLLDCLRRLRAFNTAIHATTNGNRLDPALIATLLGEELLDNLTISIDAATDNTYRAIRRGGDFPRLLRNLHYLAEHRDPRRLGWRLSFVAMKNNVAELPAFITLAAELGVEGVIVQHVYEAPGTHGQTIHPKDVQTERLFQEATEAAASAGIAILGRNFTSQGLAGYRPGLIKDCPFPWEHVFLKANRRVAACAMVWEDLDFGSLQSDPFAAIWRGEAYRRFREQMAGPQLPEPCRRCQYYGWREPISLANFTAGSDMVPEHTGGISWGWHTAERDGNGRFFRWSRAQAVLFLKPLGHPMLEIDAVTHPNAPFLQGTIRVNGESFAIDSHDFWGNPLRLPVGLLDQEVAKVEIVWEKSWNPHDVGIPGRRQLGFLVYGVRFTGDGNRLLSTLEMPDPFGQLGRGWLPVEQIDGRSMRWTREYADLLLAGDGDRLAIECRVPVGLQPRELTMEIAGQNSGTVIIPADGQTHTTSFSMSVRPGLHRVTMHINGATTLPEDQAASPRRFGLLISRIELVGEK